MLKCQSKSLLAILLSLVSATFLQADDSPPRAGPTTTDPAPVTTRPTPELPLEDLRTFTMVFDHIRRSYVEEISDSTLLENAISGLLSQLDPHSAYLDEKDFSTLQEKTNGSFGGIGIEVSKTKDAIKIISPIDDTPADRAGIQPGDLIIKIDNTYVRGLSLSESVDLMRGPKGTSIQLTIIRGDTNRTLTIDLIRDIIKITSVRSKIIEPGFGYIRIAQFQSDTGARFREHLQKLDKKSNPLKGIVIDLRRNPGGLLHAAIDTCDAIMDGGLITYTEGRLPSSNSRYEATPGDMLSGTPLVVLLDGGSASASEIVAGALQDNKRAIVIGTQSFGKGSVQTVMPISASRGIKLTTARYFTPSGHSIQAQGIVPNIEVKRAEMRVIDTPDTVKEADLTGHLDNPNDPSKPVKAARENKKTDMLATDNQLFEALNILKGIHFLSRNNIKN